jgi:hypothetical protein
VRKRQGEAKNRAQLRQHLLANDPSLTRMDNDNVEDSDLHSQDSLTGFSASMNECEVNKNYLEYAKNLGAYKKLQTQEQQKLDLLAAICCSAIL